MSGRRFPILWNRHSSAARAALEAHGLASASVPWSFVEAHEAQAWANHSQSLARLAERGGLSPSELVAVVLNKHWGDVGTDLDEVDRMVELIVQHERERLG